MKDLEYVDEWRKIIKNLAGKTIELPTVPKTKKTPVWFSVNTDRDDIYVNPAIKNKPSSKLTAKRILNYETFKKVYPLYLRRERGESVSKEVTSITVNQVYYFSVINHLCK